MDDETRKDGTEQGLDRLEELKEGEAADNDLESVSGGLDQTASGDSRKIFDPHVIA